MERGSLLAITRLLERPARFALMSPYSSNTLLQIPDHTNSPRQALEMKEMNMDISHIQNEYGNEACREKGWDSE